MRRRLSETVFGFLGPCRQARLKSTALVNTLLCIVSALVVNGAAANEAAVKEKRADTRPRQALELQSTIVGSQEQPEVIYIVPWRSIDAPAPNYKPMADVVDGQFELIDRDEWRRKLDLHQVLTAEGQ